MYRQVQIGLLLLSLLVACSSNDTVPATETSPTTETRTELGVDEAEQSSTETLEPAEGQSTAISDPNGFNGTAYLFSRTGDQLSWGHTLTPGTYTVYINARAQLYQGAPELALTIGSKTVTKTISATDYEAVSFGEFDLKAEDKILLTFTNDMWGGTESLDRNVIVSHASLYSVDNPSTEPQTPEGNVEITDFTTEQWEAINEGSVNTEASEYNREQASIIYGSRIDDLVGATDPIEMSVTENAASFDPWLSYISADNTPINIYSFLVRVRNTDGSLVFKEFDGEFIADYISQGWNGAAYDFRDNSTEPLTAVYNADGSATLSKERTELFTHLWFGGQHTGVKGVVLAVKASGDGYMQLGVDFKNENFDDFPGQDGNDGSYHTPVHGRYERVTATPQWFGVSNANE